MVVQASQCLGGRRIIYWRFHSKDHNMIVIRMNCFYGVCKSSLMKNFCWKAFPLFYFYTWKWVVSEDWAYRVGNLHACFFCFDLSVFQGYHLNAIILEAILERKYSGTISIYGVFLLNNLFIFILLRCWDLTQHVHARPATQPLNYIPS